MKDEKDKMGEMAVNAFLSVPLSGQMNNLTEKEKEEARIFVENPENVKILVLGPEKIVGNPVIISRGTRIAGKYGIVALDIINEFLYGLLEDGLNTPIKYKIARDLVERAKEGE